MHNKFMAVVQKIVHDAWNLEDSLSGVRETWSAIERLNQGDSLNVQVVKTNLFWDLGSLLLEMENPWNLMSHGFYKLMNELTKEQLASFTNASECSFLQQLSTRRVEVVTVQAEQEIDTSHIYQVAPKPQDRMNIHNAIFLKISGLPDTKAKENRQNPVTPQLIRLLRKTVIRTSSEGVPLQAEQADWLEDTDEEIDEQELEAHYSYMAKIQEVSPEETSSTSQPLEQDDSNVIPDSSNICTNDNQVDQNVAECVDERAALANLIANLTLDTEENKTILKQLKKANASLTQELEECKTNLDETSRALGEATSSRDSCLIALQTQTD
ncbi:hypothetical protein Tco_0596782 [Tanacetum coccineum]